MKKFLTSQSSRHYYTKKIAPEKYFDKILIANRGEIACRVIETCNRLGIKSVAVFTDADKNSKHVKMATEAVYIGSNTVSESYTNAEKIVNVMKQTGAQAVHPGYGFLSENADFADMVEQAGLTFIGPPRGAITSMGDKIESKLIAKEAGVNIIPGKDGEVSLEESLEAAKEIGYPVMIKAAAGGGGKGMRVAYNEEELIDGYKLSQEEARRNFANDKMLIEKFVEDPRHVEIQVLSDKHGNHIYLNERECSVQRRNQKVVEEAPAVVLDPELRKKMGEQACALAKAVDYCSAGTVEMMVDKNKDFYFLEMNTRLQVEHPVTEYITGVDLVEQMLRVAAGKELSFEQSDIGIEGWATECRVYAEDPHKNFAPSIGKLHSYTEPTTPGDISVRCDSGINDKSEISVFFDPMICKLITYGKDREESRKRMLTALDEYVIHGVQTNVELLRDVLTNETYIEGDLTTDFLVNEYPEGFQGVKLTEENVQRLAGATAFVEFLYDQRARKSVGNQVLSENSYNVVGIPNHDSVRITVSAKDGEYTITQSDGQQFHFSTEWVFGEKVLKLKVDEQDEDIFQIIHRKGTEMEVQYLGARYPLNVYDDVQYKMSEHMVEIPPPDYSQMVVSEMPGTILSVHVKEGDKVFEGQDLIVMEAMKMANVLKASKDAVIKSINVVSGDVVENETILIEFEESD